MAMRTRRHKRRPGSATRRSNRRRVRSSKCRSAGPAACRGRVGCKYASGRKRSYCRNTKNTKRRRRSARRGGSRTLISHLRKMAVPYAIYHTQKRHQRRKKRHHRRKRRGGRRR